MLSCTRSRGVVKGGRLLSASSTRPPSSQQQTFVTREGVWRGSEIGSNSSLTDCRAAAAALTAHHERRLFSTTAAAATAGGDAVTLQAAPNSYSSGTVAAAAAVAAAAVAGTALGLEGSEAPREDTSSTFPGETAAKTAAATVAAAAASLLPGSSAAKCGGHRRIQDMYHMVDSPIGQGEGRHCTTRACSFSRTAWHALSLFFDIRKKYCLFPLEPRGFVLLTSALYFFCSNENNRGSCPGRNSSVCMPAPQGRRNEEQGLAATFEIPPSHIASLHSGSYVRTKFLFADVMSRSDDRGHVGLFGLPMTNQPAEITRK